MLFAGPNDVHICNDCLEICHEILLDFEEYPETNKPAVEGKADHYCSFCGTGRDEVKHLIAGPTAYICSECVVRFREDTA